MDCFAALAMTAACCKHNSAFSRRIAPELFHQPFALKSRERRECRVLAAPAVSCAMCTRKCAHEHTGTAGAARHSLRSGFTAYTALSLETNSFCLHRRRIEDVGKPGWVRNISAGLTPATGARTTRLCRPLQHRSPRAAFAHEQAHPARPVARPALPRPPLPAPYVRDDRDTPLLWARDGGSCTVDLGSTPSGIFFARGVDTF